MQSKTKQPSKQSRIRTEQRGALPWILRNNQWNQSPLLNASRRESGNTNTAITHQGRQRKIRTSARGVVLSISGRLWLSLWLTWCKATTERCKKPGVPLLTAWLLKSTHTQWNLKLWMALWLQWLYTAPFRKWQQSVLWMWRIEKGRWRVDKLRKRQDEEGAVERW